MTTEPTPEQAAAIPECLNDACTMGCTTECRAVINRAWLALHPTAPAEAHPVPCVHPAGYEGECPCPPNCGCCTVTAAAPAPEPELREQYAAAMAALDCAKFNCPVPDKGHEYWRIWYAQADAVLNVRDTELQQLRAQLDDERAAKQTAAGAADRFRDVLSEALGHEDENPGDDVLVAKLREHFGKTGPEPTNWRDRLVGYEAIRDQINAAARDGQDPS